MTLITFHYPVILITSHYPVTVITDNVPLSYDSDDVPLSCHLVSRVLRRRLLLRVLIGCELSDESSPPAAVSTNPLTVGCCDVDNDDIGVLLDSGLSADNTARTVGTANNLLLL